MGAHDPAPPRRVSSYARAVIPAVMATVVLVAAFIKGAIGFGFPSLATPLLSLVVDVKTAVVLLILPNIVMDGIQFARRGAPLATVRRFGGLLLSGGIGIVLGTRVLTLLSPPAGFVAGVIGGVTNSPATALVLYFQGIGLAKHDFISSVAFAFFFYKLVQLGAVTWYGLLPWSLLWGSVALTVAALAGFAVGLRVQDRLDQRSFNRAVLVFLAVLGAWLLFRSLG